MVISANARNGLALANGCWHNHRQECPVRLLVLNLMPTKVTTELQFLKQFDRLDRDVELIFLYPTSHRFKGTATAVIRQHYASLAQVASEHFAGLIITGAPVEKLPFSQVDYWPELGKIITWAHRHVRETLLECWAAQAGLYLDFAIPKRRLAQKLFGVFSADRVAVDTDLGRGLVARASMPQSRHSTSVIDRRHLPGDLQIIADSAVAGPFILRSAAVHHTYITGHPEYDRDTLAKEYARDRQRKEGIQVPQHYFDKNGEINYSWNPTAQLIYQNWLNIITK